MKDNVAFPLLFLGSFVLGKASHHAMRMFQQPYGGKSTWEGAEIFCQKPHEEVISEVGLPAPSSLHTTGVPVDILTATSGTTKPKPEHPTEATFKFLTHRNHEIISVYCLKPPTFGVTCYAARPGIRVKLMRNPGNKICGPTLRVGTSLNFVPWASHLLHPSSDLVFSSTLPSMPLSISQHSSACPWGSLGF